MSAIVPLQAGPYLLDAENAPWCRCHSLRSLRPRQPMATVEEMLRRRLRAQSLLLRNREASCALSMTPCLLTQQLL